MVVLGVWGKYHCICVVMIDLRCKLDLLWDYPIPDTLNILSGLIDSTGYFSYFPTAGA